MARPPILAIGSSRRFLPKRGEWRDGGPPLDASIVSDEAGGGEHRSLTGAFVGMAAFDISGGAIGADFGYFEYQDRGTK
jgi:xylan 1,4-beta-xylosidase